jgi:hypothetical protein
MYRINYWSNNSGWYNWNLCRYDLENIKKIINTYTETPNNEDSDNGDLFIENLDNSSCDVYSDYVEYINHSNVSKIINDAIKMSKLEVICNKCFDLQYIIKFKKLEERLTCQSKFCIVNSEKVECPICNIKELVLR